MITERNMIFANPQAYRVFPQIGNPYNTGITDTAIYEGYLQVADDHGTSKSFKDTNIIDFTGFIGVVDIDQYTDTGSVKLGRWRITDTIENDVMSSMVLWYDLAKQGATNESMVDDPIPFEQGMNIEKDKYYTQYDILYKAIQNANTVVYDLKDIPAIVQPVNNN